jgi:nitroreductase
MEFLDLVRSRRSVRNYRNTPVEENKIQKIFKTVRFAPSACNYQPWVFIVIRNQDLRFSFEKVYNKPWFYKAPVIIAACCNRSVSWRRVDGKDYGDVDIAIAFDHLTLAATELGLGTCWIGAFNAFEAREVLKLPENIDPVAFTPLGYPVKEQPVKNRKQINEFVHWDYYTPNNS